MPAPSSLPINPALDHLTAMSGRSLPVAVAEYASLLDQLRQVPDPRGRRGIRHALASVLAIAAAAVLAGARSFTAIGEWIADAPVQVQAALEIRHDLVLGVHQPPHEATIRRVLEVIDADALDAILAAWLAARLQAQAGTAPAPRHGRRRRRAIAVDGKALRGARLGQGATVHLLAALDHTTGLVLAQSDVEGKTNEITRFRPLLEGLDLDGCVLTADALHTQRDHATFLVTEKNAHYVLIVKKNQPTLHTQLKRLLWKQVPVADRQCDRGHGRDERRTCSICLGRSADAVPGSRFETAELHMLVAHKVTDSGVAALPAAQHGGTLHQQDQRVARAGLPLRQGTRKLSGRPASTRSRPVDPQPSTHLKIQSSYRP